MKKKKICILIVILIIIALIITGIIIGVLYNKKNTEYATTSLDERKMWNEYLNNNPYLYEFDKLPINAIMPPSEKLLKLAITSKDVRTEEITEEEKKENVIFKRENSYKKSKKEIEKYLKDYVGVEFIQYNLVNTFVEDDEYLIIGEDYVYYSETTLPEKIYIATEYEYYEEENEYKVTIYEYDVTSDNKKTLNKMLESGKIKKNIQAKKYELTGTKGDSGITVSTKIMKDADSSDTGDEITVENILEDINEQENLDMNTNDIQYKIVQEDDGTIVLKVLDEEDKEEENELPKDEKTTE